MSPAGERFRLAYRLAGGLTIHQLGGVKVRPPLIPPFKNDIIVMVHIVATTPELHDVVGPALDALLAENPDLAAIIAEFRP